MGLMMVEFALEQAEKYEMRLMWLLFFQFDFWIMISLSPPLYLLMFNGKHVFFKALAGHMQPCDCYWDRMMNPS